MSEPVNPLFEEEKEFLERKKLEYERALRGDVEQLKEQGVQLGKVALVGAGIASGVWLLSKAFGGRKRRKKHTSVEVDFDDYDEPDYQSQHFADFDDDAEDESWAAHDIYFGSDDEPAHGSVYHTDNDSYDEPGAEAANSDDDNGLGAFPDFPAHSSATHGEEAADEPRPFWSEAHSHPTANLPYDDSRRLPEGHDFTADATPATDADSLTGKAAAPKQQLGPMLVSFAKSDFGKMLLGQAASVAMALATKVIKDRLPHDAPDTANTSDLAASTGTNDGYAHGHPATPQPAAPDAYSAPADAPHYREPLA